MSRLQRTFRALGGLLVAILILAPLTTAYAQQSPEWGEESLAPEAVTEPEESAAPENASPQSEAGSQAPTESDMPNDPDSQPAEAGEASKEAVDHPSDTEAPAAPAGPNSLYLPQLQGSANEGEEVTTAEADASAAVPPSRTASGDFDGNGVRDLAIGVPFEDIVTGGVNRVNAGAVHVFYGNSEGGLTTSGQDFWHQAVAGVPGTVEAGDNFGYSLAAGNFNGDAFDDLAIGIPLEDDVATNEGFITVLYGSAAGLTTAGAFFSGQPLLAEKEASDQFGYTLAAGNFNGDARDDLAIGIPFEDIGGTLNAGSVQVFYGTAGGLSTAGNQIWRQSAVIGDGFAANDQFGWSLTAARFDNDIFADLAVGVPFEDVGAIVNAGQVDVIYGTALGLSSAGDQSFHQDTLGVLEVAAANDNFGYSLAAGDFDNDNLADLAIGVPNEEFVAGLTNDGVVQILYGAAGALTTAGTQIWSQNTAGILDLAETGDQFGRTLAAGDFNCDIRADLAVGVPFENIGAIADAGMVNVIYGINANGLGSTGNSTWYQSRFGILDASEASDWFGFSLATGDFDANCAWDLSAGVPLEDIGAISNAGAANVIYGVPTVGLTTVGDQFWHQNYFDVFGSVLDFAEAGDEFGYAH